MFPTDALRVLLEITIFNTDDHKLYFDYDRFISLQELSRTDCIFRL